MEVVHVNHPLSFWIHYTDRETSNATARLDDAIADAVARSKEGQPGVAKVTAPHHLKRGRVYLAPFHDGVDVRYYRARLDGYDGSSISKATVRVHFLDYGNNEARVQATELIMLERRMEMNCKAIFDTPAMGVECAMAHVQANPVRDPKGIWDKESID